MDSCGARRYGRRTGRHYHINGEDYEPNTYVKTTDNNYRFVLGHDSPNPLIVIGFNPSTADDKKTDRTVRRVLVYAVCNDFDGFLMLNVHPCRSTNPQDLLNRLNNMDESIHQQNLRCIEAVFRKHSNATVLVAYGDLIKDSQYLGQCRDDIVRLGQQFKNLQWRQIGDLTSKGNPRHPSRGPYQELKDFHIEC